MNIKLLKQKLYENSQKKFFIMKLYDKLFSLKGNTKNFWVCFDILCFVRTNNQSLIDKLCLVIWLVTIVLTLKQSFMPET